MLLPYSQYKSTVQAGLRSGYRIEFIHRPDYSYPRLSVDKEAKVVTVYNQHSQNIESLKALIANREKYEREGRVMRVFAGAPSSEDLYTLGLTPQNLGVEVFTEFLGKMQKKTLTNQYMKQLIGNKV
jgi:hypothetical protein